MRTVTVQEVLTDERWAVHVTYAIAAGGEPWPVDVHVQLLPEGVTGRQVRERQYAIHGRDWDAVPLAEVPPGGLSQRALCLVNLRGIGAAIGRGARATLALQLDEETRDELRHLLRRRDRKPGRPPARPLSETLQVLEQVASQMQLGAKLGEIAATLHMSRGALRDLLSWARHDAQPALFTNPGRGRRGGALTPEAQTMLDDLKEKTDGKRRKKA